MPQCALRIDRETSVGALITEPHGGDTEQAWAVQQVWRTAGPTAELQPVQRRTATGFQVGLIPHRGKFLEVALESKPRVDAPTPLVGAADLIASDESASIKGHTVRHD
jgi:hypothetical protein